VVRYRPADGTVTVTPVPSLNSTGPYSFVATLRGSILRPLDSVPGYAIPVGGRAIELSGLLDAEGPLLAGPKPGQLWVAHGPGAAANLVLVDPEGRRLGPTISLSSIGVNDWPAPDGSGYALVSSGSGIYDARPDGLRLVTHGIVLAAGPTGFLVYECSDDAKCGVAVGGAAGGSRHPIDGIVLTDHQRVRRGIISPDGAFAAFSETVTGQTSHSELHLINLASGLDRVVIDALDTAQSPGFTPAFAFSPDGSWLLFATHSGHLDALDTTTGAITVLPTAIPPVSAVLVQPTSGGPAAARPLPPGCRSNPVPPNGATRDQRPSPTGRPFHVAAAAGVNSGSRAPACREAEANWPTISENVRLNVPRLLNPTAMQTSVTLSS
jgi:hypothetical protein